MKLPLFIKNIRSGIPLAPTSFFGYLLLFIAFFLSGGLRVMHFKAPQQLTAGYYNPAFFTEEELEFLNRKITGLLIDSGFNGNVFVSRYGTVIYDRSFGHISHTRSQAIDRETAFQLASISKTFTATAVLMLHRDSLIHIDDAVKKHIPEFPYDNITIRHLLNHTSGLQNYMWLVERVWKKPVKPTNEDILQLFIANRRGLYFPPGNKFEYSNTGYVFLGLLIERVSGVSYSEFIHTHIFEPIEMNRSFVYDLHKPKSIENRAYGFRQSRGRYYAIPDDNLDGPLGDKGIFSTIGDLYKWDQAIYRSELLPSNLWQMAFEKGKLHNDSLVNYGLGWRLQSYIDKKIVHHPGRWHGFRTSFKRFVDDHTTIIVLGNNNRGILEIIEGIQDILYAQEKEIWLAANKGLQVSDEMEETEPAETPGQE